MGIVLSHTTARAVYQTVHSIARSGIEPCSDATIFKSHPSRKLVDDALRWLAIHNVEADENTPIETMVFERNGMRNLTGCRTHVSTKRFSSSRFVKLTDDISIVGVELCALQAATYLPFRKLVEYYFELWRGLFPEDGFNNLVQRKASPHNDRTTQAFLQYAFCLRWTHSGTEGHQVRTGRLPFAHGNSLYHDAHAAKKRRRPGDKGPRNRL